MSPRPPVPHMKSQFDRFRFGFPVVEGLSREIRPEAQPTRSLRIHPGPTPDCESTGESVLCHASYQVSKG